MYVLPATTLSKHPNEVTSNYFRQDLIDDSLLEVLFNFLLYKPALVSLE